MKYLNKIIYGNASSEIKKLKSDSVDLICIDPPYNIKYNTNWDKWNFNWISLVQEFRRILKWNGSIITFGGWSTVCKLKNIFEGYFNLKNWIIWDRIKGRGAKTNVVSTREDILWFVVNNKYYTFNKISSNILKKTKGMGLKNNNKYRALSNVWTDISPIVPWSKEKVKHPTQKPISLIERIIKIFSNEENLVLDCFAGSGTTGEACKNLNRDFILIEKEEKYIDIINNRLNNK